MTLDKIGVCFGVVCFFFCLCVIVFFLGFLFFFVCFAMITETTYFGEFKSWDCLQVDINDMSNFRQHCLRRKSKNCWRCCRLSYCTPASGCCVQIGGDTDALIFEGF